MLKKLHIFTLKSFIGPLIFTFFVALFILLMQFLWKYIEDLVGKGLDAVVIAELMLYAASSLVPLALPLAILLASLMTFGNMGENYELTAIKAAGISLQRSMVAIVITVIFISIGAFFFSNEVLPYTNLKMGTLLYDVTHKRPELNIETGIFNNDIDGYSIRVRDKNPVNNMMYDFLIYDHTAKKGNVHVLQADSGLMQFTDDEKYMILELFHGKSFKEVSERSRMKTFPHQVSNFDTQTLILSLEGFDFKKSDESLFKHNYHMLNLRELEYAVDTLSNQLAIRSSRFKNDMVRFYYFRYEAKNRARFDTIGQKTDSIRRIITPDEMITLQNFDSIFAAYPDPKRQQIINTAVDYAKSARISVNSSTRDLKNRTEWIRKHEVAWHKKFTLSIACFVFLLIGAPLGAIIRKGGLGIPVVISVVFFLVYYMLSITGEKFAKEGVTNALVGMWAPTFILLVVGVFVTYKATTDSSIMSSEAYTNFFKKITKLIPEKFRKIPKQVAS